MKPAARIQAAIELLDEIIVSARDNGPPADQIVRRYFKARRYAGSKDRRAVTELAYRVVRRFGERPESGRAAMAGLAKEEPEIATLFDGERHSPAPLHPDEPVAGGGAIPAWLLPLFAQPEGGIDLDALLDRAPLDIRVRRSPEAMEAAMAALPDAERVAIAKHGLRLPNGTAVEDSAPWREGLVEVQDAGSQAIVDACHARSGLVLDLCAGAGGKTLALADHMTEGKIVASDIARVRLDRLMPRAERSGVDHRVETRLLDPGREVEALADLRGKCDLVVVDAPCSGSGTWRRNPETRWRLTQKRLDALLATQQRLLDMASELVSPDGRILYIVCSLLEPEGAGAVARFLGGHADFGSCRPEQMPGRASGDGIVLSPCHDSTDGFFFAILTKSG